LVELDPVADILDPAADDRLGDRLAQGGHHEFCHLILVVSGHGSPKASSSSRRCSRAWALKEPVAGLACSGRLTERILSQPNTSANLGMRKVRAPMFRGSSWTHAKCRAPVNRSTTPRTCSGYQG